MTDDPNDKENINSNKKILEPGIDAIITYVNNEEDASDDSNDNSTN